ncbi:hypothetical protein VFMJ11_1638 [Aliivibrio fischeri MJ11]|uniref:Uncharacterized protein n=1 Tax=Aliivibrio fischeri (strain MJ11) TaxID=388396 RepID=B5FEU2_ALIFM|nr:hypothetical protein VFMJ11_1638 [Aliivibrio fischeri MJ11]
MVNKFENLCNQEKRYKSLTLLSNRANTLLHHLFITLA